MEKAGPEEPAERVVQPVKEKPAVKPEPRKPETAKARPAAAEAGVKIPEPPVPEAKPPEKELPRPKEKPAAPEARKETERPKERPPEPEIIAPKPVQEKPAVAPPAKEKPRAEGEKQKERIKLGLAGTIKSIITREVRIEESDVKEMLDSLELELLEADVDITVAEAIKETLSGKLVGAKIGKGELHAFVSRSIRETLVDILTNEKAFTIPERLESAEKPLKIMFLGINGAGKTTTIAKVAKMLLDRNRKVVFAAADTFRAAAIEQMSVHADRLGVKVIKREYGSDPTSVAYDAVNYAKAHGIDAVLIDTAGRQDTNISLMNEMKKMNRIIQPDIKIYIGESIAGNAIIEQVSAFNREIGLDAVILTKLDCDPKGGTMLSINKATGVPIVYVGVGQAYDDLERFEPGKIVGRIVE